MRIVVIDQVGKLKNFQLLPSDEVCFFGSRTVKRGHFTQGGGGDWGGEWGGGRVAVRVFHWQDILPYVRESRTVLYSGFHTVDSGFQVLDSSICQWNLDSEFQLLVQFQIPWAVFRFPKPRIPDSMSKIFLDSRFHKHKFPRFRTLDCNATLACNIVTVECKMSCL